MCWAIGVGKMHDNAIKLDDDEAKMNAACSEVVAKRVKWRLGVVRRLNIMDRLIEIL